MFLRWSLHAFDISRAKMSAGGGRGAHEVLFAFLGIRSSDFHPITTIFARLDCTLKNES